jgi:flagellar motor switch/type III secretory pathway protein FliN
MKEQTLWTPILDQALSEMKDLPFLATPPSFQLENLENQLKKAFQIDDLLLQTDNLKWREKDKIYHTMGEDPVVVCFQIAPLEGNVFWILPQKELHTLTAWFLTKKSPKEDPFFSSPLEEGFYRFILLNVLQGLESSKLLDQFSIQFADCELSQEEKVFCIDLQINHSNNSCWGRLCLTSSFKTSWQGHSKKTTPLHKLLDTSYELTLSATIGTVSLSEEERESLQNGDIILFEDTSYEIDTEKGLISLQLGNHLLFYAKRKNSQIKIADYATYQEKEAEEQPPIEPSALTIEVTKIQMPLQKLLQLKPGDTLENEILPNVCLLFNDKVFAEAELIQLKKGLGIRLINLKK